jgi:hypothetical protein
MLRINGFKSPVTGHLVIKAARLFLYPPRVKMRDITCYPASHF